MKKIFQSGGLALIALIVTPGQVVLKDLRQNAPKFVK